MQLRPWAIGLFIVLGFASFTAILFLIGNQHKAFEKHVDLYTELSNLGGLASGAKVRVSGLDAGELKKIDIPQNPSGKFKLELEIEEKALGMVRKDSVVSIESEGVVGDKVISIKKGTEQAEAAKQGTMLPSKEPLDFTALMEKGSGLLDDVQGTVTDLRGRMNVALDSVTRTVNHGDTLITALQPDVKKIARQGTQITAEISSMISDLNAGKGPAGMLLKDPAIERQLRTAMANVQAVSENVQQASVRANQTIADFQDRNLAANAQVTLDNIQALTLQLKTTVTAALAEDNLGTDAATNLRQTLSNLNRSTTNLAEDTEALKHNFFFRGFFKKRGFYTLDELTPSEYEAACGRDKCNAPRTWIQASNVFLRDKDGIEQLTAAGRAQINTQVAPEVDLMMRHIVVVEGYSNASSPDQRYVDSRRRADLVRSYLEMHFHLEHSNVGVVAMGDKPPQSARRDQWDGVAINLVDVKSKDH